MSASARSAVDDLLPPLLGDLRSALGEHLVGLYLYGSVVSGGFDSGVSDIDLVAVVGGSIDGLDLAALDVLHRRVIERDPSWTGRLEIVYVAQQSVAEPTRQDPVAVISPGEPFHVTGPSSDWLANWYLVRETGVTVFGPPPTQVIGAVSHAAFLDAIRAYLGYLRGVGSTGYAVLSACRAACTLATGTHCSKQDGAAWVRARLPDWAWLIDAALRDRLSRGSGFKDEHSRRAAREFVELIASLRQPLVGG